MDRIVGTRYVQGVCSYIGVDLHFLVYNEDFDTPQSVGGNSTWTPHFSVRDVAIRCGHCWVETQLSMSNFADPVL